MVENAIGLMAKYPRLGQVKTRLARDVGEVRALEVYRRLLDRTAAMVCEMPASKFISVAFVTPPETAPEFADEYTGFHLHWPQRGDDLGARMQNALDDMLKIQGIITAMLVGADIPELNWAILRNASSALEEHDLVLGPTVDGGYYLIGVGQTYDELFTDIAWGTDQVLPETLKRARELNLEIHLLEELRDLDDADDLKQFIDAGVIEL